MARADKPNVLLDYLIDKGWAKDDQTLAKLINSSPPVLSRIRTDKRYPSARLILGIYDNTDLTIEQIRGLIKGEKP